MKYGIALGMTSNGLKSVADIMEEHIAVGNKFYFSTSYRLNEKKFCRSKKFFFTVKLRMYFI